jgi:hypothetical protein
VMSSGGIVGLPEASPGTRTITFPAGLGTGSPFEMVMAATLEPGEWIAFARAGSVGSVAHVSLPPGEDVTVPISLVPGSRVAGRVRFDGARRPAPMANVRIDVSGAGPDAALTGRQLLRAPVTPKTDGTFDIPDLFGTIEMRPVVPAGWTLQAIQYGDRDLLDAPLALQSGEDVTGVQVVFSDQVAAITGDAVGADGTAVPGCTIAVFPAGGNLRFSARRMRLARADQTGHFAVRDLPTGEYFAAAAFDVDASVWLTTDVLDRLRLHAIAVPLGDREQRAVRLPCASEP